MKLDPVNFEKYCELNCGEKLTNEHILTCPVLNDGQDNSYNLNGILNGNIQEKCETLKKFEENMKKKEQD